MNFDFFSKFNIKVTDRQSQLICSARLAPLILLQNGLLQWGQAPRVITDNGEKDLVFGDFNYWFLRDWVARSTDNVVVAAGEVGPGGYAAVGNESRPSLGAAMRSFGGGNSSAQKLLGLPERELEEARVIFQEFEVHGRYMLYEIFTSGSFITSITEECGSFSRMPTLPVPETDFKLESGKAVYRVSKMPDVEGFPELMLKAGYIYRVHPVNGLVYYSNSKAVYLGLPPNAEALGWPGLDLSPPAEDASEADRAPALWSEAWLGKLAAGVKAACEEDGDEVEVSSFEMDVSIGGFVPKTG
jgi:hypothetical protein